MKKFITGLFHFVLAGLTPLPFLIALYLYSDPFRVLKDYNDYSFPYVISNRDYISTTMFIKNQNKHHYNSFILGSSRTLAFKPESWKKYLDEDDNPFIFDASGESVYGIYTKLKYLDSTNIPIKNVLIVLCRDVSFRNIENDEGHLYIKHTATSGESKFAFHLEFFKAFLDPKFLFNYYCYEISGHYSSFMSGYIETRKITFDTITNEIVIIDQENELLQSEEDYYSNRTKLFYERKGEQVDSVPRITGIDVIMLEKIKLLLEKNKTNYRVIVSPLYDQIKLNPADFKLLQKDFGNNFYDFSGKNSFTDDKRNFYETKHFRPHIGDSIFNLIYSQQ